MLVCAARITQQLGPEPYQALPSWLRPLQSLIPI